MTRFPAAAGAAGRVLLFLAALGPVANGFQRLPPVVAPMRIMPRAAGCPAMAAEQRPADPGGGRALGRALGLGRCHSAPRAGEDEGGAVRSTSGHLGTAVVRKLLGVLAALSIGSVAPPASAWGRADSAEPAAVSRLPSLEKLLQRGPDSAGYGSRPLLTPPAYVFRVGPAQEAGLQRVQKACTSLVRHQPVVHQRALVIDAVLHALRGLAAAGQSQT